MKWSYLMLSAINACLSACNVHNEDLYKPMITPPPLFPRAGLREAFSSGIRDQGKAIMSEKGGTTKWIGVNDPAQYLTIPDVGENTEYLTKEQGSTKWIGSNSEYLTHVTTTTSQNEVVVTTSLAGAMVNIETSKGALSVTLPPKAVNAFESAAVKACKPAKSRRAGNTCADAYIHALSSAEDVEIDPSTLPNMEDILDNSRFNSIMKDLGISEAELNELLAIALSKAARRYYALALPALSMWKLKGHIPNLMDYDNGPEPTSTSTSTSTKPCPTGAMAPFCVDEDCHGDTKTKCIEEKYTGCSCLPMGTGSPFYLDPWVLDGQQKVLEALATGDGVIIDPPKITPTLSCTQYLDKSEETPGHCLMLLKPTPTGGEDCPPSTTDGQLCTALGASLPTSSVTCGYPFVTDDKTFYGRFDTDMATDAINKLCEDESILIDPDVLFQPHDYLVEIYGKTSLAVQVGWAKDQKYCSPKQSFKLKDHQEGCKVALQRAVNDCDTDTTTAKFGGTLLDYSKDHGCLLWDIGAATSFQSEPNAKPPY